MKALDAVVLGGTGFLGSWTIRALSASGLRCTAIGRSTSDDWRLQPAARANLVRADERDWPDVIRELRPRVLISFDWNGVTSSQRDNLATQEGNLSRLQGVLEAAGQAGVQRFVGAGSQAEYGPQTDLIAETTHPRPATQYGKAKLRAMELSQALCANHSIEWVWARVFSVFGPLDNEGLLLPTIADQLRRGEDVELTDGKQLWSYLFAPDAGRAFAAIASAEALNGLVNVAHPLAPPLRETVEQFVDSLDATGKALFGAIPSSGAVHNLRANVALLQSTGWTPDYSIAAGLDITARWLTGHPLEDPLSSGELLPQRRS